MTTEKEQLLLLILKLAPDSNTRVIILQSYIAENGPVSDAIGPQIRELLNAQASHS